MDSAMERIRSLKVSDVMTRNVVEVFASQTMDEVARSLAQHDMSAAPVIDEKGRCVGIISATDFLRRDISPDDGRDWEQHKLVQSDESLKIDAVGRDVAGTYMTKAIQTIPADVAILKAAKIMCAEHVHRLPVLDQDERVVGVISTMDIVAALLTAFEEADASFLKQFSG